MEEEEAPLQQQRVELLPLPLDDRILEARNTLTTILQRNAADDDTSWSAQDTILYTSITLDLNIMLWQQDVVNGKLKPTPSFATTCRNIQALRNTLPTLDPLLATHLFTITRSLNVGALHDAEQRYFRMSIGDSAWPLGVPVSAVHTLPARDRVSMDNTVHILNNPTIRSYMTAVKSLINFRAM
eukprot:PhF_6_TR26554/c0_g1_i1/m.38410